MHAQFHSAWVGQTQHQGEHIYLPFSGDKFSKTETEMSYEPFFISCNRMINHMHTSYALENFEK